MPFRLNEFRAKIQFTTSAEMPSLVYQACLKTGAVSNTVYIQHAVIDALARDLDLDPDELRSHLPEPRGAAAKVWSPEEPLGMRHRNATGIAEHPARLVAIGPANTDEEVR